MLLRFEVEKPAPATSAGQRREYRQRVSFENGRIDADDFSTMWRSFFGESPRASAPPPPPP
jgi:hypothetical protein